MTGQSGSHAGAARRGRGYKDSLETWRCLRLGTTPPLGPPPARLAPPPPGSPSAHALSPRGVTWRFKSRRLARVGAGGGRARSLGPGDSRSPRPGRSAPPAPRGLRPGAGRGGALARPSDVACFAPRGLGPRGGRLGAVSPRVPEEVAGRPGCRVRGASPGPRGAVLSRRKEGCAGGAGAPLSPAGRRVGGRGRADARALLVHLPRQSFLWKVAIFSSLVSASPERGR